MAVAPLAMPASFVKSALLIEPAALPEAGVIEIAGDPPPDETIGAVPVTVDTPPPPAVALIWMDRVAPEPEGVRVTFVPAVSIASTCALDEAVKSEIVAAVCVPV